MALSFVGSAEASAASGASVTVTHPGTIAADDVVYFCFSVVAASDLALSMSTAGYTQLAQLYANDTDDANLLITRKKMPATPDSTAVTTGGLGSVSCQACEHVWRGQDLTTPEDATTTTATGIDSATANSPSITTATANAVVLTMIGATALDAAITAPTNYINQVDISLDSGDKDGLAGIASRSIASPAAENPAAWTNIATTSNDSWAAVSVAIRPAGAGGGPSVSVKYMHYMKQFQG